MTGRILVVDGAAASRITLKVRLAAACHDPLTAGSGAEALACVRRAAPDLVLLGGHPLDMGQAELCRRIVEDTGDRVPVVMLVHPTERVDALRAGASAVLDAPADELTLLARIRALIRDCRPGRADRVIDRVEGLAEACAEFDSGRTGGGADIMLIADQPAMGLAWRHALSSRLQDRIRLGKPEQALAEAALGRVADLYVIAADIRHPGDGLRLLSELRARPWSRNAAFVVLLRPERVEMAAVALDLGAGEVLSAPLQASAAAEEAALRIAALIARKRQADDRRRSEEIERALARTDPLTGLANRRVAIPRIEELCAAARLGGAGFAVVSLDIDRFKRVNDEYGHAAGDRVLATVATRLRGAVDAPAFVARMGGEEFLAVLPNAAAEAAAIAARLRNAVAATSVPLPAQAGSVSLTVTLSAGVAICEGAEACDTEVLLERADRALRDAKSRGRNCQIVAGLDAAA